MKISTTSEKNHRLTKRSDKVLLACLRGAFSIELLVDWEAEEEAELSKRDLLIVSSASECQQLLFTC